MPATKLNIDESAMRLYGSGSRNSTRVKSFMGEAYECAMKDGAECVNQCQACNQAVLPKTEPVREVHPKFVKRQAKLRAAALRVFGAPRGAA